MSEKIVGMFNNQAKLDSSGKVVGGMDKLKTSLKVFVAEVGIDNKVIGGLAKNAKKNITETWNKTEGGFFDKLKRIGHEIKDNWNQITDPIKQQAEIIEKKYAENGIKLTKIDRVEIATTAVGGVVGLIGKTFQGEKLRVIKNEKGKLTRKKPEGWKEKHELLEQVRVQVKEKKSVFQIKLDECDKKLKLLFVGRKKLEALKSAKYSTEPDFAI